MIELPRPLAEAILAHARAWAPREACGLLAGTDGVPRRVYAMRNAEARAARFRFDAREQREVLRHAAASGLGVVAFFHSHPRTPAVPSEADTRAAHRRDTTTGRRVAAHPNVRHVIVSLHDDPPELRAFRFHDGRAIEEAVVVS